MRAVFVLVLALSSALFGQVPATPDFSGTWKVETGKEAMPKNATGRSGVLTIVNSPPRIEFHYIHPGKDTVRVYKTDGKERALTRVPVGILLTKAYWKNGALIIENRLVLSGGDPFNGTDMHMKSTWSLSDGGRELTEVTQSDAPKVVPGTMVIAPKLVVTVYDRQ